MLAYPKLIKSKMILNELLSIISAKDQIESVRNYLKELEEMED